MRLWTIQPIKVLNEIKEKGRFICDINKSSMIYCKYGLDKQTKFAYDWMCKKMVEKGISQPKNVDYPIWAWYTYNWKNKKPDLRCSGLGKPGEKSVCIELEIPDKDVLLSDFNHWHYVLNNSYMNPGTTEEVADIYDYLYGKVADNREKKLLKEDSWEKIFEITPFDNIYICTGRYVQATFWELKSEYIKSVKYFTCK